VTVESIHLGPLGRLMRIDMPSDGFSATLVENGVEHAPLSGRVTKDVFSRRRLYEIDMDGLTPRALSWFEMLYTDAITGPFYLIDTSRTNRLRARISSTGTAPISLNANSTDWINPGAGPLTYPAATAVLLPRDAILSPGPSKAVQWVPAAANVLTDAELIPVIPGEPLTFSCYAQAGAPSLEFVPYNAALAPQAAVTGTVVIASTPPRRYVTYTPPSNGTIVAVRVQIRAAAAGTFTTLAWMLNPGVLPDDWTLGTGVPTVMLTEMDSDREPVGRYTTPSLVLKET
jgi:hypothetical protein